MKKLLTTVILCGKKEDDNIGKIITSGLSRYGGVQQFNGSTLTACPNFCRPSFLLYECEQPIKILLNSGIFVFKNSFESSMQKIFPENFIPILDAQNQQAIEFLNSEGVAAVTCGTSVKDTLSIASIEKNSAVISLQRNLRTSNSKILEPHDFFLKLRSFIIKTECQNEFALKATSKNKNSKRQETEIYPLLALCTILLLTEKTSVKGYEI